jgi:ABC-type transport system substrate-binding protein
MHDAVIDTIPAGSIAEFCDPRLDTQIRNALAADADNSPNVGQRWAQADRTVTDDAPLVPLVIPSYVISTSKRVGNYQVSAAQGVLPDQLWVR